jgi:hypothetical protein
LIDSPLGTIAPVSLAAMTIWTVISRGKLVKIREERPLQHSF